MHKIFITLSFFVCTQVHAFTCFVTLIKDSCWTNYNVTATVVDADSGHTLATITVPQGTPWGRGKFACEPKQTLSMSTVFSPIFWQNDQNKVYPGQHDWQLPIAIKKGETAWNIPVCYPEEFAEVPVPPTAGSNCKCNKESVPSLKFP